MRPDEKESLPIALVGLFVLLGGAIVHPANALAAECTAEIEGRILQAQRTKGAVPLVDPRCFVRSSSAATVLTLVDGRSLEESAGIGPPVLEHSMVRVRIPATCANKSKAPLVRDFRAMVEITTIRRASSRGLVDQEELEATAVLICGPRATRVAVQAMDIARLVVTYPDPPGGTR